MRYLFALVLFVTLSFPALAGEEPVYERVVKSGTIRCSYINWYPYYFNDYENGGKPAGMVYDLVTEIGNVLDLKIEWAEEVGWGSIGEGFKSGRYDMACISMWPDAAKYKNFLLTRPYYYSEIYPWVRADDTRFDGEIEAINNADVKIAAIDGAFTYKMAESVFPAAEIVALPPLVQSAEYLMTVVTGKADVLNSDYDEIKPFLESNPGKLRMVADVDPIRIYPHVMAVPHGENHMKTMIDLALDFLINNGTVEAIRDKYKTRLAVAEKGFDDED